MNHPRLRTLAFTAQVDRFTALQLLSKVRVVAPNICAGLTHSPWRSTRVPLLPVWSDSGCPLPGTGERGREVCARLVPSDLTLVVLCVHWRAAPRSNQGASLKSCWSRCDWEALECRLDHWGYADWAVSPAAASQARAPFLACPKPWPTSQSIPADGSGVENIVRVDHPKKTRKFHSLHHTEVDSVEVCTVGGKGKMRELCLAPRKNPPTRPPPQSRARDRQAATNEVGERVESHYGSVPYTKHRRAVRDQLTHRTLCYP